jgi:hypothetical protein
MVFIYRSPQYPQVWKIPIALRIVQSISDDETIRDSEPHVVHRDIFHALPFFQQKSANSNGGGMTRRKTIENVSQREPGINNVLHDQDVLPFNWRLQILEKANDPATLRARPVTRDGDEINLCREANLPKEVRKKDDCTFEYTEKNERTTMIVTRYLRAQFNHSAPNISLGEENLLDILLGYPMLMLQAPHSMRSLGL